MWLGSAFVSVVLVAVLSTVYSEEYNIGAPIANGSPILNEKCPHYDDPNHTVMLPYPNDCRKYYTCQNGLAFEHQCPASLYWSQTTYRCDYLEYSNCNSIDHPGPSDEVVYSPFPGDCSRFYETRALQCEQNLQWSSLYQRCVAPQYANCQNSDAPGVPLPPLDPIPTAATPPTDSWTPPSTTKLPIDVQSLCRNSVSNAYIPYPADCQKFIHCGPTATVLTCPGNLYWNPPQLSCTTSNSVCAQSP
ncbi:peritrophin-1 [Drosophila biarmipes]|uniref:peritrophin-1 n=1 Tax=Drosophila biarmipes TaxID=125945 RepID=UPI0021CC7F33|nr:peritrophin-1 [Drosophila biarmipes]